MSTYNYDYQEILSRIQNLPPDYQLKLLEDVAAIIRQQAPLQHRRSILEFEGIGQKAWEGIDVKEFIKQERDSWNG
jgi:hypothetical protein